MKRVINVIGSLVAVLSLALLPTVALAANSDVTQQINSGVLSAEILNGSRVTVPSPSFSMSALSFSFDCQTATGTLGSAAQRLYVTNPSATSGGNSWSLSLAATGPWSDGGSNTYAYNDAAGSGCTNGQLTVNPAVGTVTADCVSSNCTSAVITKGSSTAMTGSTAVTIMSSAIGDTVWRGYITGVSLSQAVPGEVPAASYTLPVTLTATAS
jgi:hypothetical protein